MTEPATPSTVARAAEALGIKELVPALYQDLLQPAAREVGEQLVVVARTVGMALLPLRGLVFLADHIRDHLAASVTQKLATKPLEEIRSPDPLIAGPILQNIAFAADVHDLREMYATLLARAMHSPSASKVHPSFAHIIQQLSPVEAQLLKKIAELHNAEAVLFEEVSTVEYGAQNSISSQWNAFCKNCCDLSDNNISTTLYHNLIRLGIFLERTEADSTYRAERDELVPKVKTTTTNYVLLTMYGCLFLDACLREL